MGSRPFVHVNRMRTDERKLLVPTEENKVKARTDVLPAKMNWLRAKEA